MHTWWYAGLMFSAYLLFMQAVRWLASKLGPRVPSRWRPFLTRPARNDSRVLWIGIAVIVLFYVALFASGRAMGLN